MALTPESYAEVRELRGRYPWLIAAAALAFLTLVGRLWYLQMVSGAHYAEVAANTFIHKIRVPAPRGLIRDATGKPIAENRPSYNVLVTPAFLPSPRAFFRTLGRVLDLGSEELRALEAQADQTVAAAATVGQLGSLPVKRGLTAREEKAIFEAAVDLEGIEIRDEGVGARAAWLNLTQYPSRLRVLRLLQEHLKLPPERYERISKRVLAAKGLDVFEELKIASDIGRDELRWVTLNKDLLPGVKIQAGTHRHYPHGDRAAHALGYTKEVTEKELERLRERGYRMGDYLGKVGIERLFEKDLRGTDGAELVVVDSKGRIKDDEQSREMLSGAERVEPVPGNNLVLSLDMDLTEVATSAIGAHPIAAVVALEPATGFLLALASKPSVDLNRLAGRISKDELLELETNPLKPLGSKALLETYFPGSTFKLMTSIAALETGAVKPSDRFHCSGSLWFGRSFGCHRRWGHGSVDFLRGMAYSCDVYFYRLGMKIGLDTLQGTARQYGFGEKTGLGFQESAGFVPTKDWYRAQNNGYYPAGQDLNHAVGQGDVKVTLLQLALAYAAVANGGHLLKPQIVRRIESPEGKALREIAPVVRRKTRLTPDLQKLLVRSLTAVTNAPFGTAYWRRLREHVVAGKTGTAQRGLNVIKKDWQKTWEEMDDALFVGFSPPEKPEVLVAAVVERGGHGASVAMPIVNKVVKAYFDLKTARRAASLAPPGRTLVSPLPPLR
jgi:penicillin-binding protein 2